MSNIQMLGEVFKADDGTTFQAATLYDVASANKGVIRRDVYGQLEVYADKLFASGTLAEKEAKRLRDSYNAALKEKEGEKE